MKDFITKLVNSEAPFFENLREQKHPLHIHAMNMAVSVSSLDLFRKGIRWSRNFRYNDTKGYYGLSGDRTQAYEQLVELQTQYKEYVKQMEIAFKTEDNI